MTQALLFFGATSVEMHSNKFSSFGKSFSFKILTIKWMHKYLNILLFWKEFRKSKCNYKNQIYSGKHQQINHEVTLKQIARLSYFEIIFQKWHRCLQFISCAFLSRFQDQKKINGSHFSKGYWQHYLLGAPNPFVKQSLMQKNVITYQ